MPKAALYIAASIILIGIFPLPYGYYTLLRIVACGAFAWAAYIAFSRNEQLLTWILVVFAVAFNPIIKVYFTKEIWMVIDFIAATVLIAVRNKVGIPDERNVISQHKSYPEE